MDLLRLALSGGTARDAVDVLCALLETHGQVARARTAATGRMRTVSIADAAAFVVETAGVRHWAVEVSTRHGTNISMASVFVCRTGVLVVCRTCAAQRLVGWRGRLRLEATWATVAACERILARAVWSERQGSVTSTQQPQAVSGHAGAR